MSSGPKTFLYISSIFFRSLIGNFLSFFFFLPLFDWEFSLLVFLWGQGLTFSPWVKVYGKLGFWLKACSTAGHDICQGLVWSKDKRGCPTLFTWHKCNNDDLEILCKTSHACTYADTQMSNFYGHVMLGLIIHFLYFSQPNVSKICSFINLCIHPSLFWVFEKLSQHLPFRCIHIFFKNWLWSMNSFKEKLEVISFHKHVVFLARQLFIFIIFFFSSFFFFSYFLSFPFLLFPFLSYLSFVHFLSLLSFFSFSL